MNNMLSLKKLVAPMLALGLLVGTTVAGHAITWTIDLYTDLGSTTAGVAGTTPWTTIPGIFTNGGSDIGLYRNFLGQAASNPSNYMTPTNVTYGRFVTTQINPGLASFNNVPADFEFRLSPDGGATFHNIRATGVFNGTVNSNQSNATWTLTDIIDLNNPGAMEMATFLPNNPTAPAFSLNTTVGGKNVTFWIERERQVPAPGQDNQITGYIADVPEPGTVALLVGSGIGGSLMLRRRRKA